MYLDNIIYKINGTRVGSRCPVYLNKATHATYPFLKVVHSDTVGLNTALFAPVLDVAFLTSALADWSWFLVLVHVHSVEGAVHQLVELGADGSWYLRATVEVTVLGANTEEESGAGGFSHDGLHFALLVVGTVVGVTECVAEFVGSDKGSIASLGSVALALHHLKSLHTGGSGEGVIFLR